MLNLIIPTLEKKTKIDHFSTGLEVYRIKPILIRVKCIFSTNEFENCIKIYPEHFDKCFDSNFKNTSILILKITFPMTG